jgi:hypothetical protein
LQLVWGSCLPEHSPFGNSLIILEEDRFINFWRETFHSQKIRMEIDDFNIELPIGKGSVSEVFLGELKEH